MPASPPVRPLALLGAALLVATSAWAQPSHYPEGEQWYNATDDGRQHYVFEMGRAAAPGDTVVVLHGGWGAEHAYLLDPLAPLADRQRLVLYDQRGSLRSPAPDSTITLDRLVADLEDLRLELGLDRMTLVAHSMGNALAYAYLAQHPDRVRGLVLLAPVHPILFTGEPSPAWMGFVREVWPEADSAAIIDPMRDFLGGYQQRAIDRAVEEGLVPASLRDADPETIDQALGSDRNRTLFWRLNFTMVNSCTGDRWREMQGGRVFYNQRVANAMMGDAAYPERAARFWPALRDFDGPVRVLIGTCDYVDLGPLVWPHIVEHLGDGALTVIDGAGHSLWMDRPDRFHEALAEALHDATE